MNADTKSPKICLESRVSSPQALNAISYSPSLSITDNRTVLLKYLIFPMAVYVFHSYFFSNWMIDDAGISYAYARSFAEGHGLVSQPGVPPVEGFSNFLWVMFLTPLVFLKISDPVILTKIASFICIVLAYFVFVETWWRLPRISPISILLVLLLISINTSFVVWTTSGLENPLNILLLCLLLRELLRISTSTEQSSSRAAIIGILVTAISLTRPDGVMYIAVFPVCLLIVRLYEKKAPTRREFYAVAAYLAAFILSFGAFLLFRMYYFDAILPNTYYAKGGIIDPMSIILLKPPVILKLKQLMSSVVGSWGPSVAIIILILTAVSLVKNWLGVEHIVVLTSLLTSVLVYLLLPNDWMGEFRFGTPFILFFWTYTVFLTDRLIGKFQSEDNRKKALVFIIAAPALVLASFDSFDRTKVFSANPTVPFRLVEKEYGIRFNKYADALGLMNASVLLPDLGGTLAVSRLRVYDLAGLCDKNIARTLIHSNAEFRNYVFDEIRPSFIHSHHVWTLHAQFFGDERFRRDYVPIHEYLDASILKTTGRSIQSGDYVRREVIDKYPDGLSRLRSIK